MVKTVARNCRDSISFSTKMLYALSNLLGNGELEMVFLQNAVFVKKGATG